MASDFSMKANDRKPSIEATLGFSGGTLPGNLTGTVTFIMRRAGAGGGLDPSFPVPKVDATAQIVDAATWKVRYDWIAADTDEPGLYLAEWEHTDGTGKKQTFPGNAYHSIEIFTDLDGS